MHNLKREKSNSKVFMPFQGNSLVCIDPGERKSFHDLFFEETGTWWANIFTLLNLLPNLFIRHFNVYSVIQHVGCVSSKHER